jgi:hypothetical protein
MHGEADEEADAGHQDDDEHVSEQVRDRPAGKHC